MDCSKSPLIHKHHIIPRYMGGTDGEENLVEVTIAQHAMFHYCNYQLWGNIEDKFAWKGLSGQIGKEEILLKLLVENQKKATKASKTPEARKKQKEKLKEIKHQQGEKNSQYGKMWITDGTKEGTYRINKGESIPQGFRKGRISRNNDSINYYYIITTPEGEIVKTKYLLDYCDRNNLQQTHMYQVLNRKRTHHKGYKVYREYINT
jgi:hypothetical protein